MKFTAQYLDNGFYIIADRAAGALCTVLGQKLPQHGYEKFVMLRVGGRSLNAWLKRTDLRACLRTDIDHARGWRWALHVIRKDAGEYLPALGSHFTFQPIAST